MKEDELKSPFKFLDPFEKKDKDFFFGRDKEVEMLYDYVNKNRIVLVYGQSGTGKTSIIRCGLANSFEPSDWIPIFIRRHGNLNESFIKELSFGVEVINEDEVISFEAKIFEKSAIEEQIIYPVPASDYISVKEQLTVNKEIKKSHKRTIAKTLLLIKKITEKYLRPVYLIFDQFEELLILGNEEEENLFIDILKFLVNPGAIASCHVIIVMREEYFAWLDPFEREIPEISDRRMRVETVHTKEAKIIIKKSCEQFNITLEDPERNTDQIVKALSGNGEILLPYLQVYLDQLWRIDYKRTYPDGYNLNEKFIPLTFTTEEISDFGTIEEVFSRYMTECIQRIQNKLKENFNSLSCDFLYDVFDLLINDDSSKRPLNYKIINNELQFIDEQEKIKSLNTAAFIATIKLLEKYKILRDDGKSYELAHDSMGLIISEIKSKIRIRPRLLVPEISGNPYKGLLSYNPEDYKKFFGRNRVVGELLNRLDNNNLVAVVGPSGAGKSSLIKAGLMPKLENLGYYIISVKPEDFLISKKNDVVSIPKVSLDDLEKEICDNRNEKVVLYIDQFEQLSTRFEDENQREQFISFINALISNADAKNGRTIKIILSIRSDYEFEFDLLFKSWKKGKFNIPPFLDSELREVITEPAYYAGLEFYPDYLVDIIVREVQQSSGTLPLLSYTLFRMYESYLAKDKKDGFLSEDIFNKVGGVIGGLQTRANKIYEDYPVDDLHRKTIKNVILRMITGIGERAGLRVLETDLVFLSDDENRRVKNILNDFIESRLIITGKNEEGKVYYEPAHDSLVKNWSKVSDWIAEKNGKEFFYYSPILREAIKGKEVGKLWDDDPRLQILKGILYSQDNWLNKEESEFVIESDKKRKKEKYKRIAVGSFSVLMVLLLMGSSLNLYFSKIKASDKALRADKDKTDEINRITKAKNESIQKKNNELLRLTDILQQEKEKYSDLYKISEGNRMSAVNNLRKKNELVHLLSKESTSLKDAVGAYSEQVYLLTIEKNKNDLLKEPFARTFDPSTSARLIDTLIEIKYKEKKPDEYEKLKNSLNKVSDAMGFEDLSPNKALTIVKQAFNASPHPVIDSVGQSMANNNLFYIAKKIVTYKLGSSIYLTAQTASRSHFAYATLNGIRVGMIQGDSIILSDESLNEEPTTLIRSLLYTNKNIQHARFSYLTYTTDNNLMAVSQNKLYKWTNFRGPKVVSLDKFGKNADSLIYISPTGKQAIIYDKGRNLKLINIQNFDRPAEDELKDDIKKNFGSISYLVFSPEGSSALILTTKKSGLILDLNKKSLKSLPEPTIYTANFTSDGKNIIYASKDGIHLTNLDGRKVGNDISYNVIASETTKKRISISKDWKNLIIFNSSGGYGYTLFENFDTSGQKDSVLYFSTKKTQKIIKTQITNFGVFDFINNNSILSYTKSKYNESFFSYNLLIFRRYDRYNNLTKAYASIKPILTEDDQITNETEKQRYEKATNLYLSAENNSNNLATKKSNLIKSKNLMKGLLSADSLNEEYFYTYRLINRSIFELDSNFVDYSKDVRRYIRIETQLLKKYSVDTSSYLYKDYKYMLSADYGDLSYYLLFVGNTSFDELIEIANKGLALDPTNNYIYTNIAAGYLLNKEFSKSVKIYKRYKGETPYRFKNGFTKLFLDDLALLERKKVISNNNPKVFEVAQQIKCWLQDAGCPLDY